MFVLLLVCFFVMCVLRCPCVVNIVVGVSHS